ncbi:hypothetical protein EJ03DRAFT_17666 [Teratosphaeria nubilosa]|uniref:Uncharacterized protein n=1 Tax=Teratosphaeria nubilosa TaxID=161662 RepID=A0A6G1KVR4_9PEZI|nr:hypothetical protein EJ03DRAFT_17666 [Teratosphaeria nubilosa]
MAAENKTIILITGGERPKLPDALLPDTRRSKLRYRLLSDPAKHTLVCSRSMEKGEIAHADFRARDLAGVVELGCG